jgi:hypothetical protein
MRWYVRTLCHVTQITQIAVFYYFLIVGFVDAIDFHGAGLVNQVEKGRKCLAQADAPPTAMANIENPVEFLIELLLVEICWALPINGVTGRRVKTALSRG